MMKSLSVVNIYYRLNQAVSWHIYSGALLAMFDTFFVAVMHKHIACKYFRVSRLLFIYIWTGKHRVWNTEQQHLVPIAMFFSGCK